MDDDKLREALSDLQAQIRYLIGKLKELEEQQDHMSRDIDALEDTVIRMKRRT